LKRIGESLSDEQSDFKAWAVRSGVPYAVCHTFEAVMTAFDHWSCLSIEVGSWRR